MRRSGGARRWAGGRSRASFDALAFALAALSSAGATRAQTPNLPEGALATCPDRDAFLRAVAARISPGRARSLESMATRVSVAVVPIEGRFRAQLSVDLAGGTLTRALEADSCAEVLDALAFVASLALDPEGARPRQTEAGLGPPRSTPTVRMLPAGLMPSAPGLASRPSRSVTRLAASAGASAVAVGGIAPSVAWGGSAFVDGAIYGAGPIAGALRLTGLYAASGGVDLPPFAGHFRLVVGRLEACPRFRFDADLASVEACVGGEYGSLFAAGEGVPDTQASGRHWAAFETGLRARVRVAGPVFAEAGASLLAPLTRRTFVFDPPRTEAYRVPGVAGAGGLGLGFYFL